MKIVDITPELAKEWLNGHNRHLRPTVWQRYARDMVAGDWVLNGETIKRTEDDTTDDGQHRLKAIIESGCTIRSVVVFGLPHSAQETIDRGLPRNIPDALRLRGEKDVNNLAAAVAQVIVLGSPQPTQNEYWPSTSEATLFLDQHGSIRESCLVGARLRQAVWTPASTAAAMHFMFSRIDPGDADVFFASLGSGADLVDDSPILRLREVMFREVTANQRMRRPRLQAFYIKSWNAWRDGIPMKVLRWSTGGSSPESFPVAR
jgi:hypothetical protein